MLASTTADWNLFIMLSGRESRNRDRVGLFPFWGSLELEGSEWKHLNLSYGGGSVEQDASGGDRRRKVVFEMHFNRHLDSKGVEGYSSHLGKWK